MNAPLAGVQHPVLIVVPCLNEARHIARLLLQLLQEAEVVPMLIAVADGGSSDGTVAIVSAIAASDPRVVLLRNPDRIQSAGINHAVASLGARFENMIRLDAHSHYPEGFCHRLLREAERTGADSVVVALRTSGSTCLQKGIAAAQNSLLGTGGSAHRVGAAAGPVDHGHHAFMRLDAFRAIGGYDASFSHNEDAEYDIRLAARGGRIWLTDSVAPLYEPREGLLALFRQYRNYGSGRTRTMLKHRRCSIRQLLPALVLPAMLMAAASGAAFSLKLLIGSLAAIGAFPAVAWLIACLSFGCLLAVRQSSRCVLMSGPAALVMHFAWSVGCWRQLSSWLGGAR